MSTLAVSKPATSVAVAYGSGIGISVFDADSINLDEWVGHGPVRSLIEDIKAAGWRLVSLAGRENGQTCAVFYERVLDGYDDRCEDISILINQDGTVEPYVRGW